ncbi:MAG: M56 family metallopeptidase [Caulobacterales bacterium]
MGDLLLALVKANVAASLAILLVLALRRTVRARFGPDVAYRMWIGPPLAALGAQLPARPAPWGVAGADSDVVSRLMHVVSASPAAPAWVVAWAVGALAFAGLLAAAQHRFITAARAGRAGPAVVGVAYPRIVMPAAERFTAEERALVIQHELEHIERGDPRANALAALLQCLAWFNPLVHLAVRTARFDQELACDDAVAHRRPKGLAAYARTLLKAQLASLALPLGCDWPAPAPHPLEERIAALGAPRPSVKREVTGLLIVWAACVSIFASAWVAQPPSPLGEMWRQRTITALTGFAPPGAWAQR